MIVSFIKTPLLHLIQSWPVTETLNYRLLLGKVPLRLKTSDSN